MTNIQAIDLLKGLEQSLDDYCELNDEGKSAFHMAIMALEVFGNSEQLPPAQPEPQEGHWIWVAGDLECSKCHTRYPDLYPDYDNSVACPHCGARMKGATT